MFTTPDFDDKILHYILIGIGLFAGAIIKTVVEWSGKWAVSRLRLRFNRRHKDVQDARTDRSVR